MKGRYSFLFLLISYIIVIAVNLAGNYQYYAAGNDWHYSVYFVLSITTICWAGGTFALGPLLNKMFQRSINPTVKLLICVVSLIAYGVVAMVLTMKAMVLFFHFHEQTTYDYINNSVYAALFSLVIGLMVSGQQFLIRLKKNAEEKEQMEREIIQSQYEALKSQVNPHFLFNSLNTLAAMIPRQPDIAVRFVEQMAKVFRYSLQNDGENTVDLASELKVAQSYLFLNEQRFEGKLIVDIKLSNAAMQKKIITQSLLMLAENAIKHNEISTQKPLTISIFDKDNYLVVSNTLQKKSLIESSTNMGLINIQKRYEMTTSAPVMINTTEELFTVKIPLL